MVGDVLMLADAGFQLLKLFLLSLISCINHVKGKLPVADKNLSVTGQMSLHLADRQAHKLCHDTSG